MQFEADLRFGKQRFELTLPIADSVFAASTLERLLDDFRAEYAKRYGKGSIVLGAPIEFVSLRAVGIGRTVQATLDGAGGAAVAEGTPAPTGGSRAVRVGRGEGGIIDVAVHTGSELRPGHVVTGPALVDGSDTTIWIPSGTVGQVDRNGTLALEVGP